MSLRINGALVPVNGARAPLPYSARLGEEKGQSGTRLRTAVVMVRSQSGTLSLRRPHVMLRRNMTQISFAIFSTRSYDAENLT